MSEGGGYVVEVNPAHVLSAISELSAQPQLEREQHAARQFAGLAEDDSDAHVADADACLRRGDGCCFPLGGYVREEAVSLGRVLGQRLVASFAVVAERGGAQEDSGLLRHAGEGFAEQASAVDAAVANLSFIGVVPALAGDARAAEMDDGFDSIQACFVYGACSRVPLDFVGGGGCASNESGDLVAFLLQAAD